MTTILSLLFIKLIKDPPDNFQISHYIIIFISITIDTQSAAFDLLKLRSVDPQIPHLNLTRHFISKESLESPLYLNLSISTF